MDDAITKLTQTLVRIDTTGGRSAGAAECIAEYLEEVGLDVKLDEYKTDCINLTTSVGQGPAIILSGHMDVVPIGNSDQWTYDPFSGKIVNGELWGRGSVDMKGGTASICGAIVKLLEHESDLNYKVTLALSAEEELGLLGARDMYSKGIMKDAKYLLVAEPTGLGVAIMEKGLLWSKISAQGKQAHASRPDLGINAIEGLASLIPHLHALIPDVSVDPVGKSTLNLGTIQGGSTPNVVPELAEMICDFRITPGVSIDEMILKIDEVLRDKSKNGLEFTPNTLNTARAVISEDLTLARIIAKNVEEQTENKPDLGGTFYATDAAELMKDDVSLAIFGPGSTELLHQTNERLDLHQLRIAFNVITSTILEVNMIS